MLQKFVFATAHGQRSFFGNNFEEVKELYFGDLKNWSFAYNEQTGDQFYNNVDFKKFIHV